MEWSRFEVEAIVSDYLKMLALELSGQTFNKSAHRKALKQKLGQRSDGSIEFKHGNISAVMIELGFPYIRGYQPRGNYQSLLFEVASEQIKHQTPLDIAAQAAFYNLRLFQICWTLSLCLLSRQPRITRWLKVQSLKSWHP